MSDDTRASTSPTKRRHVQTPLPVWPVAWWAGTLLCLPTHAYSAASERWMLMSRHGECSEVGVLQRKFPELPVVASPDQFVGELSRRNIAVNTQSLAGSNRILVEVPERDVSVIFVPLSACGEVDQTR